jgi:hypothetical protein
MTWTGYILASVYPGITKQIDKLIILIIFLSLLPAIIGYVRSKLSKNGNAQAAPQ